MGQLARKHRKNRGERFLKRSHRQAIRHEFNQGRVRWGPSPLSGAMVKLLELEAISKSIADYYARHLAMSD
jgi:hypothetical protein